MRCPDVVSSRDLASPLRESRCRGPASLRGRRLSTTIVLQNTKTPSLPSDTSFAIMIAKRSLIVSWARTDSVAVVQEPFASGCWWNIRCSKFHTSKSSRSNAIKVCRKDIVDAMDNTIEIHFSLFRVLLRSIDSTFVDCQTNSGLHFKVRHT